MSEALAVPPLVWAALFTFLVNLPFGYWRRATRKFSPAWFVAVHGPVPLVVALRLLVGVRLGWLTFPVLAGTYFAGQFAGGRLRGRKK